MYILVVEIDSVVFFGINDSTLIELDYQIHIYVLFGKSTSVLICFKSLDIVKLFPNFVPV